MIGITLSAMGGDGYEPDEADWARMRFLSLLPGDVEPEFGHFTDREIDSFSRTFDADADELHELFRAVLFLRGWRLKQRVPPPSSALLRLRLLLRSFLLALLRLVLRPAAAPDRGPPLGADRRPAADLTPPMALLRARSVLTCAPPARIPCPAGMTG